MSGLITNDDDPLPLGAAAAAGEVLDAINELSDNVATLFSKLNASVEKGADKQTLKDIMSAMAKSNQAMIDHLRVMSAPKKPRQWTFTVKYDSYGDLASIDAKEL